MKNQTSGWASGWAVSIRGMRMLPALALLVVCAQAPGHAGTDRRAPNAGCDSGLPFCAESNLVSAFPGLPQQEKRTIYTEESFHWQAKLAPGQTLEVINTNGDIDADGASDDATQVNATKSGHGDSDKEAYIEVVEYSDGATICAVYAKTPEQGRCHRGGVHSDSGDFWHHSRAKINFSLKVAQGVNLKTDTTNGSIHGRGLKSVVDANTTNGTIDIATSEWASGRSTNGRVEVTMGKAGWSGELNLATTNGAISVSLPASAAFKLHAATTNGNIHTDFPITVQGTLGMKNISGTVGDGGRDLHLATTNGGIEVRKSGA